MGVKGRDLERDETQLLALWLKIGNWSGRASQRRAWRQRLQRRVWCRRADASGGGDAAARRREARGAQCWRPFTRYANPERNLRNRRRKWLTTWISSTWAGVIFGAHYTMRSGRLSHSRTGISDVAWFGEVVVPNRSKILLQYFFEDHRVATSGPNVDQYGAVGGMKIADAGDWLQLKQPAEPGGPACVPGA